MDKLDDGFGVAFFVEMLNSAVLVGNRVNQISSSHLLVVVDFCGFELSS